MSKSTKFIFEFMEEINPDAMRLDGFDDCAIGIVQKFSGEVLLYSEKKIIRKLMKSMTKDEAWEYFNYNILGAYVGDYTPVFLLENT